MTIAKLSRAKRALLVGVAAVGLVVAGAGIGAATGGDPATHARPAAEGQGHELIAGTSTGAPCRVGYDTQASTLVPPDDSTTNNTPAAAVQFKKRCRGGVVALLTSEISTPGASDFVHMDMRATCVGTGGFGSHCTVGQQVFASPGHSFVQNGAASFHVGVVQMAWTMLLPGVWRFEALPGGNGVANLQFRSFVVQAFPGG